MGAVAVVAALSGGCAGASPRSAAGSSTTVGYGRGSMEDALARMIRMRGDMMKALDAELGARHWKIAANDDGPMGAGCNDGRSDTVGLRMYTFSGVYPPDRWHEAASVVEQVGRRYGFDVVRRTVDRPGNLDMTGLAPDGGSYNFGMATATVLSVTVGCYQWTKTPGADAWQTLDPKPR
ncbi:MAG TPA: LppA family lipoprotein [Nocardioides sp.]|nr:LppA family lipoprotein [Nocardioides sp.]